MLGNGKVLGWDGCCGWGTGVWFFVDFEDEGMCLDGWGSALGLIWRLGLGMWVGMGSPAAGKWGL